MRIEEKKIGRMNVSTIENCGKEAQEVTSHALVCHPWLVDLESTLNNVEGSKAFESHLARCNMLPLLEFIWATDGMKTLVEENPARCDQLVSCIYKNYIISGSLFNLSDQVVHNIARTLEDYFENPEPSFAYDPEEKSKVETEVKILSLGVFDEAKKEVEIYLKDKAFPQFQKAVELGEICVGTRGEDGVASAGSGRNQGGLRSGSSKLASHPEAFARALCEKLEGLQLKLTRQN